MARSRTPLSLPPFTALSRQGGYAHTLKGYFYTNLGGTLKVGEGRVEEGTRCNALSSKSGGPHGDPSRRFFLSFSETSSSLKLDVWRRWSGGLWKFNQIESKTVSAFA
jgi:hypothetical protein